MLTDGWSGRSWATWLRLIYLIVFQSCHPGAVHHGAVHTSGASLSTSALIYSRVGLIERQRGRRRD